MSTQLPPQIVAQAADWFVKFRAAEVSVSEREEFLRWLQRSPEHVQAYIEEALSYSDEFPVSACERLLNRIAEPCSAAPTRRSRNGAGRCRQK